MSTTSYAVRDSATMLRRRLLHLRRYPSLTIMLIGMPAIFLLLFVYVFGGTLGDGIGVPGLSGGREAYVNYVAPGILLYAVASAAQGTAISIAMDMTSGIIARFRTLAIARVSVLTGHVLAAMVQTVICLAAMVGLALLVGYRPDAGVGEWFAAIGILLMIGFALTWLTVAMGMASKTVESASNVPMFLILLPFLGSGFVPPESMPDWLGWFAHNQPFTPVIESVRALLASAPVGDNVWLAVAWSAGIALVGYLWAKRLYNRGPRMA